MGRSSATSTPSTRSRYTSQSEYNYFTDLNTNVKWFRGGLVIKAHRLLYGRAAPLQLQRLLQDPGSPTTRWSTTLSSDANLPQAINFRAKFGAHLVTQHPGIGGTKPGLDLPMTDGPLLCNFNAFYKIQGHNPHHPGGNLRANLKSISHRCFLREVV